MQIVIVTSPPPDRKLIAAAVRHKSWGLLWVVRGLGIVLVLVALVDTLIEVLPGAAGVVIGLLLIFAAPPWLVKRAVDRCWRVFGTQGAFEISDAGLHRTDELTRHGYAWPAFTTVEVLSGQLLFSVGKAGFMPMSTAELAPGQVEQVLELAAAHGVRVERAA